MAPNPNSRSPWELSPRSGIPQAQEWPRTLPGLPFHPERKADSGRRTTGKCDCPETSSSAMRHRAHQPRTPRVPWRDTESVSLSRPQNSHLATVSYDMVKIASTFYSFCHPKIIKSRALWKTEGRKGVAPLRGVPGKGASFLK